VTLEYLVIGTKRLLATGAALGLAVVGLAGPAGAAGQASASTVRIKIDGVDRAGKVVDASGATLAASDGRTYQYFGFPIAVQPGTYLLAADIPTPATGSSAASDTLVVSKVRVRAKGTIRLNGRGGRRLRVSLIGAQASQQTLLAAACLHGEAAQAAGGGTGNVYVQPSRAAGVGFFYFDNLQSASGVSYLLAGSHRHGIPDQVSYRQHVARLARVNLQIRNGEYPVSNVDWGIQTGWQNSPVCAVSGFSTNNPEGTFSALDYRTPGPWTTTIELDGPAGRESYELNSHRYLAGHHYTDAFAAAAAGPAYSLPEMAGSQFNYGPLLFQSPGITYGGQLCCSKTTAVLRLGAKVVKRQTFTDRCQSCFQAVLHRPGWYILEVSGRRSFGSAGSPAWLLSNRVTISWRFHAIPRPPGSTDWHAMPVTTTWFRPQGLSVNNTAPASGRTKIAIAVERRPGNGVPEPRVYRIKAITVQASTDGGASWHTVKLVRTRSGWLANVRDPATGFVALRSIVTDVHGDRSVETIYRAYAIAS
jgi:hypothetical protein